MQNMKSFKTSNEKPANHNTLLHHHCSHNWWKAVLPCNTRDWPNIYRQNFSPARVHLCCFAGCRLPAQVCTSHDDFLHAEGDKWVGTTLGPESVLDIWEHHFFSAPFIEQNRAFFSASQEKSLMTYMVTRSPSKAADTCCSGGHKSCVLYHICSCWGFYTCVLDNQLQTLSFKESPYLKQKI